MVGDAKPGMIYDFGGMPELRSLVYPAPGDPVVAMKIADLLQVAGFAPAVVQGHGYDHGTWVPLMLLYPEADIPVVQLSVQPQLGPAHHVAVGRALASLKNEDLLVIGSGSATQLATPPVRTAPANVNGLLHGSRWAPGLPAPAGAASAGTSRSAAAATG